MDTFNFALTSSLIANVPYAQLESSIESVSASMLQSMRTVGQSLSLLMPRPRQVPELELINRLPPEAISEILQLVMTPSQTPEEMDPRIYKNTPVFSSTVPISPFPLTQVCRRWRHIAQHTTQLWRSIFISHPGKHSIHRTSLWMAFCGQLPLEIHFNQSDTLSQDELQATVEIINLLGRRSQQWSVIEFHFEQNSLPPFFVAKINELAAFTSPRLKDATISHLFGFSGPDERVNVQTTWESLNKIRSLKKLNWYSEDGVSRPLGSQLQSLTINGISARELIAGLELCEKLQDLDAQILTGELIGEHELKRIRPIIHSQLRHVALKGNTTNIKAFLHSFTFPELFSVELSSLDSSTCPSLWTLLIRSQCTLTKLVLGVDNVEVNALAGWFELDVLQSLETMVIVGAEVTDTALLMLTCPPVRGYRSSYFENLKYLSLATCSPDMDEAVFCRMLGSRLFTPTGQPSKVELVTAAFTVHDKTNELRMYEDMYMGLVKAEFKPLESWKAENWRGWNDRSVTIKQL